jgi:acetylornithine deacetylase/succinyl-diaminopimelate desuccinylase-like protein
MSRDAAVAAATAYYDRGGLREELARHVALRTESQRDDRGEELGRYVAALRAVLEPMDFGCEVLANPMPGGGSCLYAERIEDPQLPVILSYGHGDVVHGQDERWSNGRSPWTLTVEGERWYGRGTADNKGQHLINLRALGALLETRGRLGFNAKVLIEFGEEIGSPGLRELCARHGGRFAADVLIASDGPRFKAAQPTLFLGARGALNFDLIVELREGGHHSGNWGGLLANPGIVLANALASIVSAKGEVLTRELVPEALPHSVRQALADLDLERDEGAPEVDPDWGEPGLSPVARLYGWNTFEVLAFATGDPERPVNAIPPRASAHCQIRFVAGRDPETFLPALRAHLDARGFAMVRIERSPKGFCPATRLDPASEWPRWAAASIARTTGKQPAVLPNFGGSLPNDVFSDVLGLPTLWVPHSYPGCSQHAPDEHLLGPVAREGLALMAGLFWDLAENAPENCPAAPQALE